MAASHATEDTDQFMERMGVTLNEGFKALMIAFGLKTGLFRTLVDLSPAPKTSQEIADSAGLKERYVREWLGGMVVSGIVDVNSDNDTYYLPAHRVAAFKKGEELSACAYWCQGIPLLGKGYDAMLEAIKKDGPLGVPYSKYEEFHEFATNISIPWFTDHLCQTFIKSRPVLHDALVKGIRVLDVGCGSGYAGFNIALHYPNSTVVGLDISEEAIDHARAVSKEKGLTNLSFVCADAVKMPGDWTDSFDFALCFEVLHDVPRPDLMLDEIRRVLKAGCPFSCIDPDMHTKHADNADLANAPTYYAFSLFHCLPVSYQFPGSLGLGACWGKEAASKFFEERGFKVKAMEKVAIYDSLVHYWIINEK